MAIAKWYAQAGIHLASADVNWLTDTIKVSLHTSTYTPNQDTHDFYNDVTGECSGTNYTAGGEVVTGKTRTYDAASNTTLLGCANVLFSNITVMGIRYAVVYKSTGVPSTSNLLGWVDYQADQNPDSQDFVLIISPAVGFFRMTAS